MRSGWAGGFLRKGKLGSVWLFYWGPYWSESIYSPSRYLPGHAPEMLEMLYLGSNTVRKRCALIFHPREDLTFWNLLIQAKFSKLPHFSAFKIETVKHMIKRTKIVDGFLSPPPPCFN